MHRRCSIASPGHASCPPLHPNDKWQVNHTPWAYRRGARLGRRCCIRQKTPRLGPCCKREAPSAPPKHRGPINQTTHAASSADQTHITDTGYVRSNPSGGRCAVELSKRRMKLLDQLGYANECLNARLWRLSVKCN